MYEIPQDKMLQHPIGCSVPRQASAHGKSVNFLEL